MDSWKHRNEELFGKTAEEQIVKMTKDVDDKIHTRYEQDRAKVREENKSCVLLPAEVRLLTPSLLSQKRQWIESVDLAVNAWYRKHTVGTID